MLNQSLKEKVRLKNKTIYLVHKMMNTYKKTILTIQKTKIFMNYKILKKVMRMKIQSLIG